MHPPAARARARTGRHRHAVVLVTVALLAACTSPAADPDETASPPPDDDVGEVDDLPLERCPEGTDADAVWVHDQEPPDLLVDPLDLRAVAGWLQHGVHEGLHRRGTDGELAPQLLAGPAERERDDDGRLRLNFELRDGLRFSDGEPLTATHVRDTYELLVGDDGDGARRLGDPNDYSAIDPDSWEVDGTSFAFTLRVDDSRWRAWFPRVLPTHVLDDLATAEAALAELALDGQPVPSSGPFVVDGWVRGERLEMVRNDEYHGPHPERDDVRNRETACVASLELRFVQGTGELAAALRSGEADVAWVPPQEVLTDPLGGGVEHQVAPDPAIELWLLNVADPHLRDSRVREALAVAVDRVELVERLHEPLLGDDVPGDGHGSVLFGPQAGFDPAGEAGLGAGDEARADALLQEAGYDRDGDGTYTHPERGPLTLRLSTTGDDPLRERQQQLLQNRLRELGWDLSIDNRDGQAHLDEQVLAPPSLACGLAPATEGAVVLPGIGETEADCDLFDVAQVALHPPAWPVAAAARFRTDDGRDATGLRSEAFDLVLQGCIRELTGDGRRPCAERLDRILVTREIDRDGLVVVPLAVRPHLQLTGPRVSVVPPVSPAPEAGPLVDLVDLVVGSRDADGS